MTREVGDRLSPARGQRILDVGCGTGKTTVQIANTYGVHVTGITISNYQIKLAQEHLKGNAHAEQVHIQFADAMKLPFADASFDGAYAVESLVHMDDKRTAIAHMARVLRPGSRLVIADLYLHSACPDSKALALYYELFKLATLPTANELRDLLHRAGFKVINFTDVRANILPTTKLLAEQGRSVGGEHGKKFLELASGLEELTELGYALITAERL
jgi:ubiquinone/menaquinone biosynthesis C-methylase UbiE